MRAAVLITGKCRAGGAAVAEVCHVLGYPMGRAFPAPIAPDWRLDWEDAELSQWLAEEAEGAELPFSLYGAIEGFFDFGGYLKARIAHSVCMGFEGRIGFKGPLLAAHGLPLDAALLMERINPLRVLVTRSESAIHRSIDRQRGAKVLRRWNDQIDVEAIQRDLVVPYEALVASPAFEVGRLAEALGVVDPVAIGQAVARVVAPCS